MKLAEIAKHNEVKKKDPLRNMGIFIGYKINSQAENSLVFFAEDYDIPNIVDRSDLHVTLVGSPTHDDEFVPEGILETPITVSGFKPEVWESQKGNKILVLTFESQELQDKYEKVLEDFDITSKYKEFKPHITLSYDLEGLDLKDSTLRKMTIDIQDYVPSMDLVEQYMEPLRTDEDDEE